MIINNPDLIRTALIAWEKGTNRHDFIAGNIDKYRWLGRGGSFILSEINAAVLAAQLELRPTMNAVRSYLWDKYHTELEALEKLGKLTRPAVPEGCIHNAHNYYIRIVSPSDFARILRIAGERRVGILTHYLPLHAQPGGVKYGRVGAVDATDAAENGPEPCVESVRCAASLVRLPLFVGLSESELEIVLTLVYTAVGVQRDGTRVMSGL